MYVFINLISNEHFGLEDTALKQIVIVSSALNNIEAKVLKMECFEVL